MILKEVMTWPPALTDSQTFQVTQAGTLPATLKRCGIYSTAGDAHRYMSIVVDYQGRSCHAMISDLPEPLMHRVVATLESHVGRPLAELGDLPLVGR